MNNRVWALGAVDPEMIRIAQLLTTCGERIVYAVDENGKNVFSSNAYSSFLPPQVSYTELVEVECRIKNKQTQNVVRVDHHAVGDPGWGVGPDQFLAGSSIGQTIQVLAPQYIDKLGWDVVDLHSDSDKPFKMLDSKWHVFVGTGKYAVIPNDFVFSAAADHCLSSAYKGLCPGVLPDYLMRWRAESRSKFLNISVEEIIADMDKAMKIIQEAPEVCLSAARNIFCKDMRSFGKINELIEAAARLGVGFIAIGLPLPDGRTKVILQSATAEMLEAWPDWARSQGLVDLYGGDPARGFAGGYLPSNKI